MNILYVFYINNIINPIICIKYVFIIYINIPLPLCHVKGFVVCVIFSPYCCWFLCASFIHR